MHRKDRRVGMTDLAIQGVQIHNTIENENNAMTLTVDILHSGGDYTLLVQKRENGKR